MRFFRILAGLSHRDPGADPELAGGDYISHPDWECLGLTGGAQKALLGRGASLLLRNLTLDKRTDRCCDKAALIVWLGLGKKSCGLPGSVATNTAGHCHDISLSISSFTWPPSRLAVT